MARHNREGHGTDQRGTDYVISYQPDWLRHIKVTRTLENGRQSTKTLFRNPGAREQAPGTHVRTRIATPDRRLDIEIGVEDPNCVITRIVVEATLPGRSAADGAVMFTINDLPGTESP